MAPKAKQRRVLSPPPPLDLQDEKTTQSMKSSLGNLYSCLLCPLCNKLYNNPVTLPACAHSFCQRCINDYSCNNFDCPVCSLPITLRGSRSGKFDKTNPQIETVVNSFSNICNALNAAPQHWWKEPVSQEDQLPEVLQTGRDEAYSFVMPRDDDQDDKDEEKINNNDDMVVEDEVMDFQPDDPNEEIMDFQPEGTKETDMLAHDEDAILASDEDDDETARFPTASQTSVQSNRSCSLPSQSPDCSVIPFVASQMSTIAESQESLGKHMLKENNKNKKKEGRDVEIQDLKTPTISNLQESDDEGDSGDQQDDAACIFFATSINSKEADLLKNFSRKGTEVVTELSEGATLCLCGTVEIETGDGWLVSPNFNYLEAMARGIPILHTSSYLKDGVPTVKNRVIGIGNSSDWMGPQRAVEAKKSGDPSKLLLHGYTFLLMGTFEKIPKRASGEAQQATYTKERLVMLLELCGATVVEDSLIGVEGEKSKMAYMIRPNPHVRQWRSARKEMEDSSISLVCSNWFIQSLADYRCQEWDNYTQANFNN